MTLRELLLTIDELPEETMDMEVMIDKGGVVKTLSYWPEDGYFRGRIIISDKLRIHPFVIKE